MTNYIGNLTNWLNKIHLTNIQFMYFNASDLTKPKIKSTFKKFEHYYITEGGNTADTPKAGMANNYWYIYNETLIKYLVKLKPTEDVNVLDGDILESGTGDSYDVNAGDHIDFAIIKLKNGDSVVKTHKTVYTDLGNFVFDRTVNDVCNFVFKESYLEDFNNIKAEKSQGRTGMFIKDIYIPQDLYIINVFCNIMCGKKGGRKKQTGGSNAEIISNLIIKPLYEIRKDLSEVRIIHKKNTNHMIVLIDFVEETHGVLLVNWPITNPDNIKKALSTFEHKNSRIL